MYIKCVNESPGGGVYVTECDSYRRQRIAVTSHEDLHELLRGNLGGRYYTPFGIPVLEIPLDQPFGDQVNLVTVGLERGDEFEWLLLWGATVFVMNSEGKTIDRF